MVTALASALIGRISLFALLWSLLRMCTIANASKNLWIAIIRVDWADSAYWGKETEAWLEENRIRSNIMRKGTRGKPISAASARANSKKAEVRARVEHVFGDMKNRYGLYIRTIGFERAETKLLLAAMVYNMNRLISLERRRCSMG